MGRVQLTFRPDIERTRISFPKDKPADGGRVPFERSAKGDMLIRAGETVTITADERDFLQSRHKVLLPQLLRFAVPSTVSPVQLEIPEFFGKDEKGEPVPVCRSRSGAVHVRPNSTLKITADERDHLKRLAPAVFAQFRQLTPGRKLGDALKLKGKSLEQLRAEKRNRFAAHNDTEPPSPLP